MNGYSNFKGTTIPAIMAFCALLCSVVCFAQNKSDHPDQTYHTLKKSGVDIDLFYDTKLDIPVSNAVTFYQNHEFRGSEASDAFNATLNYRLIYDIQRPEIPRQMQTPYVERLVAFVSFYLLNLKVSAGYQEVTWGEATVMPILDVVNKRSLNQPRGFYDPAAKVPEPMIRMEWQGDIFNIEMIAVPTPERLQQPRKVGSFKVAPMNQQYTPDPEYGMRLSKYWSGLETKAYFYRHAARIPAYEFKKTGEGGDLIQDVASEDTYGLSGSYALDEVTFRGDLAQTYGMPAINIGSAIERTTLSQMILGASFAAGAQYTMGLELHTDSWARKPTSYSDGPFVKDKANRETLSWLAYTLSLSLADNKLDINSLYYRGVEKDDELIQASALYAATDAISVGAEMLRTNSESRSPLLLLNRREVVAFKMMWLL